MSLLRKYGRGLKLSARILYVELFGKPLKDSTTAPTDGQALVYVAADQAWSPGTVSGGSLPAGTNGGVLAYAGGAWASTAAGTAGQHLRSAGAGAPVWSNIIGAASSVTEYQGGARVPERTVSSNTTLDAQDEVVFVDATSAAVTLTLPAGASGRVIAVQRIAGTNNVIVQRAGADTIRAGGTGGLTSWTISDDSRHGLIYRNAATQWVAES